MEQIITAINNRDKEELQSFFSEQAEIDAEEAGTSISNQIDNFFELFQDEITGCEYAATGVSKDINYGRVDYKRIRGWRYIYVGEQVYRFYFQDFIIDRENSKNIGLYFLWIVREEESDIQRTYYDQKGSGVYYRPGYNPTDDEDTDDDINDDVELFRLLAQRFCCII